MFTITVTTHLGKHHFDNIQDLRLSQADFGDRAVEVRLLAACANDCEYGFVSRKSVFVIGGGEPLKEAIEAFVKSAADEHGFFLNAVETALTCEYCATFTADADADD